MGKRVKIEEIENPAEILAMAESRTANIQREKQFHVQSRFRHKTTEQQELSSIRLNPGLSYNDLEVIDQFVQKGIYYPAIVKSFGAAQRILVLPSVERSVISMRYLQSNNQKVTKSGKTKVVFPWGEVSYEHSHTPYSSNHTNFDPAPFLAGELPGGVDVVLGSDFLQGLYVTELSLKRDGNNRLMSIILHGFEPRYELSHFKSGFQLDDLSLVLKVPDISE